MNDFLLIALLLVSMLALPLIFLKYRTATAAQRRKIVFASVGAVVLAGGMLCLFAFR